MRIAVTGGSGGWGTLLVQRLISDPGVDEIRSIDLRPSRCASPKLRDIRCDVRSAELPKYVENADAVVHLAFVVTAALPHAELFAINVEGTKNVLRACHERGVRKLVYASSVAALGIVSGRGRRLAEGSPRVLQPSFPYAAAKWHTEAAIDALETAGTQLEIVRLRPGVIIGPHFDHPLSNALARGVVVRWGSTPIPLVWEGDVVEATCRALVPGIRGAVHLVAREPLTSSQIGSLPGMRLVPMPNFAWALVRHLFALRQRLGSPPPLDPSWLVDYRADLDFSTPRAQALLGLPWECPRAVDVCMKARTCAPIAESAPRSR